MRAALVMIWALSATAMEDPATPMGKVVELLENLKNQVLEEGAAEAETYNTFNSWCDSETQAAKITIGDAKSKAAELASFIDEQGALQEQLQADVNTLIGEVTSNERDLKSAQDLRTSEHNTYLTAEKQYIDSVDQLGKAIEVLQNPKPSFVQATEAVQSALDRAAFVVSPSPQQQETIEGFFKETAQAPKLRQSFLQQPGYTSRTGELVQTLQGIKDETERNKNTAMTEETGSQHEFDLLKQSLDTAMKTQNKAIEDKKSQIFKSQESVASSEIDKTNEMKILTEEQKRLQEITTTCGQKALEWKERTKLRSDEVMAIGEALTILTSDAADDIRNSTPTAFVQIHTARRIEHVMNRVATKLAGTRAVLAPPPSFVQTTQEHHSSHPSQHWLTGQEILAQAKAAAAAGVKDPFKNVRKMVNDMIQRLLTEAAEEAEHKGWCDTEIAKSTAQKNTKTKQVTELKSRIEELEATITQLGEETTQIASTVAELTQLETEQTKIRGQEKAEANKAMKTYRDAQNLIQNAITVLQEFYSQRAALVQTRSFTQRQAPAAEDGNMAVSPPPIFEGDLQAKTGEASGIIGILEISVSQFARLETETRTAESTAQHEYDALVQENAVRKATLGKDAEYKSNEKQKLEGDLQHSRMDLQSFETELKAAEDYLEKLEPSCTMGGDTHEERKQRRDEEIKSLQEALEILNGENIA